MELNETPSVEVVANLVKQINYSNKHLMAAMIVAGWDPKARNPWGLGWGDRWRGSPWGLSLLLGSPLEG